MNRRGFRIGTRFLFGIDTRPIKFKGYKPSGNPFRGAILMQDGGSLNFLQPNDRRKLPEGYDIPYNTPSTELAISIGGEEGEPAFLIPSFKYGQRLQDPFGEFQKTGDHLGGPFKTWQDAEEFGKIRHKYVEKGESLPSPLRWWNMQQGGIKVDPMGYWNPNNDPTKPVLIPGNNIDMTNVNFPVMGISDEGDRKVMMPNSKHKFKGNSVLEIPLTNPYKMQKGGTNPPITLTDKAEFDRKNRAYQDSLNLNKYSYLQAKYYFNDDNPDEKSNYNKREAIDRMRGDRETYGTLYNSESDKYGKLIDKLQKRTGYNPVGERYLGEGSNYIFKKPVQPYIFQERKPLGYQSNIPYGGKINPVDISIPPLQLNPQPISAPKIKPIGAWEAAWQNEDGTQGNQSFENEADFMNFVNQQKNYDIQRGVTQYGQPGQADYRKEILLRRAPKMQLGGVKSDNTNVRPINVPYNIQTQVDPLVAMQERIAKEKEAKRLLEKNKTFVQAAPTRNAFEQKQHDAKRKALNQKVVDGSISQKVNERGDIVPTSVGSRIAPTTELFSEKILEPAIEAGMILDGAYLGAKALKPIVNQLGQKYLPNAYKLNPWAFKPNSEMGYRMLGKEGFEDAIKTGVLRAKPMPNQPATGEISLLRNTNRNPNTGKMQKALDRPYFADGFIDERYASDYMAAVNKAENNLLPIPTHKGIAPPQAGSIPLENATIYKKDWLKGYKQVEVPKANLPKMQLGGFNRELFDENAEYNYYKTNLYEQLRKKNPTQFAEMEMKLSENAKNELNNNAQGRQRITSNYNIFLDENELKNTLGGNFDRFQELRNKYKYNYDYGMIEKSPEAMRQFSVNDIAIPSMASSYEDRTNNLYYKPSFNPITGLSVETNMPGITPVKDMSNTVAVKKKGGRINPYRMQQGGFSMQDAYNFIFDDDVPENTAPSTDELESVKQQQFELGQREAAKKYEKQLRKQRNKQLNDEIINSILNFESKNENTTTNPYIGTSTQEASGNLYENASRLQGMKYNLGSSGENNQIDCSGAVCKILNIPRTTSEGILTGARGFGKFTGNWNSLNEGDVLGFDTGSTSFDKGRKYGIDHVGTIVVDPKTGRKMFAHSSSSTGFTMIPLEEAQRKYPNATIYQGSYSRGSSSPNQTQSQTATVLSGKSVAARHNNPGNLKYANWMSEFGAVPGDPGLDGGKFARFPSVEKGLEAREALLKRPLYRDRTVDSAMKIYSNNAYSGNIYPEIRGKKISELTPVELKELTRRQVIHEDSKVAKQLGFMKIGGTYDVDVPMLLELQRKGYKYKFV